jgi:CubicO group peptidase (beta-lactamase class C family)
MSIRILRESLTPHTAYNGYRDYEARLVRNSDTLYWAGSLSKSMTAAATDMLVEDPKIS